MDMFASFFAGGYSLYNRMNSQRRPEHFSGYFPQIPQLIPLQTVSNSQLPTSIDNSELTERKKKNDKSTSHPPPETASSCTDKVKFSIDSILSERKGSDKETETAQEPDINNLESDDSEEDEDHKLPWLQCTRYRPPKLQRTKRKDCIKKRKLGRNPRVPFTQHQVAALEQKFRRTQYLSSMDVAELSTILNLTETRVKIWFQNRRARERRDREAIQRGQVIQNKQSPPLFPGIVWPFTSQMKQSTSQPTFPYSTSSTSS